ncbi:MULTISPECIES: glycerophosphodiester phosphodiesterase [unclassified Haladaptatus]|uniref:glycerophosphodiester phosphodiesterase n=1 Tax=unclassified Haladaptatus TaxID=2622732 RepID=UPI0021132AD9|nr:MULTISPECIES: glycerophosphodiester phosphodiesterase [unclassified Haladaptatus]
MRVIAHRGFDAQYSANTVAAVEQAIPEADMIELDIRRCASGELVVAHNSLVDINIDGVTEVDDLTASELASLDAHDGEGIQTLSSVLSVIPSQIDVNLELKDPAIVEQALSMARETSHDVIVSSFDADAIRQVNLDGAEGVELGYVLGLSPGDNLAVAKELNCDYVHPNAWHCLVTSIVADAHDMGMMVNAWTVDSRLGAWILARRGVDGVIASSPHVTEWLE